MSSRGARGGQPLGDQVAVLLRFRAEPPITFLGEVVVNAPEPLAQRRGIRRSVQRGTQPVRQPAHPPIGLFPAGERVEPGFKGGLPDIVGLLAGEPLGPCGPQFGVPAPPLVDPYDAIFGEALDVQHLVEQADRPAEKFAHAVTGEDVQIGRVKLVRHGPTLAQNGLIMHPVALIDGGNAWRSLAGVTDGDPLAREFPFAVPAIPASAGAMIFDRKGRLLILKPTYKSGWTIPGGVMEADGETPWEACRREVREECGLELHGGRLACVDFRRRKPGSPGGIRFLFDCGALEDTSLRGVVLQPEEISEYRIVRFTDALALLRGPIRRRVDAARTASTVVYLEDGHPVRGVGP